MNASPIELVGGCKRWTVCGCLKIVQGLICEPLQRSPTGGYIFGLKILRMSPVVDRSVGNNSGVVEVESATWLVAVGDLSFLIDA